MSTFFIPYGKWTICRALRAYLESMVFPIPNTNEAIPGKSIGIREISFKYINKINNSIWIKIKFAGDYCFSYKEEMELVEAYLDKLLEGWWKHTDFETNSLEYGCNSELLTQLCDFLRMGGYIIAK